jgi:Fe-S-cluster containining protein
MRDDKSFLAILDARLAEGARAAGDRLACRPGCTECCIGPFPINDLDAVRLRRGLADLAGTDPARAEAVRIRAMRDVTDFAPEFPGAPDTGWLADDDDALDRFFAAHALRPCPALDPETGSCDLYAWRPVSCRTFGLPVRIGAEDLPPCRLCFVGLSLAEVESFRAEPDPDDLEGALLAGERETIVAFALRGKKSDR